MANVIVLGAGGPAGYNVCQQAFAAGHGVIGLDADPGMLPLVSNLTGSASLAKDWKEIKEIVDCYEVPVVLAQPDNMVRELAIAPRTMSGAWRTFLPSLETLHICQDKREAGKIWGHSLRKPPVEVIEPYPDYLHLAKGQFGLPFWLRAAKGAGAKGATLVDDLRVGYHWMRYWDSRRADLDWIAEEYLPGREFCWSGIFKDGELIAGFARERLDWIYPNISPSGRTGTPRRSRTVHDPHVSEMAIRAIMLIDPNPHGVFCVDLVEGELGIPRPTEINAGRWATTSPIYGQLQPNLVDLQIRLALREDVEPLGDNVFPDGIYLLRHIDMGTMFVQEPVLF